MDIESQRTQASLHALEFLVAQLIKELPEDRREEMFASAKAWFTGHQPSYDTEALVVVHGVFGDPGGWRKR